jgi:hypothetical protein
MPRTALAMLMIAGVAGWTQETTASSGEKAVDRAAAYYHYAMAQVYVEKALRSGDRKAEYAAKAAEEYEAAVKADPEAPPLDTSGIKVLFITEPRPNRKPPKTAPSK